MMWPDSVMACHNGSISHLRVHGEPSSENITLSFRSSFHHIIKKATRSCSQQHLCDCLSRHPSSKFESVAPQKSTYNEPTKTLRRRYVGYMCISLALPLEEIP
jgi:hypothetical protein